MLWYVMITVNSVIYARGRISEIWKKLIGGVCNGLGAYLSNLGELGAYATISYMNLALATEYIFEFAAS